MASQIREKTKKAAKWSFLTEILSRIITPIINMILARILAPEAFGVLTSIIMVLSFAEIFVESGFQKYLIQHSFVDIEEEKKYMSVAFWANAAIAMLLWTLLVVFSNPIAILVGNPGQGYLLAISGLAIPLYGVIGIQNCKIKKELEFNKLFVVRMISACVPLAVTLPLALLGLDYWALIIGNLAGIIIRSILLVVVGKFKPQRYFNFSMLKTMFAFGGWTMLDGFAVWATNWIDSFLIAQYLSSYYLGLYKNVSNTVSTIFLIATSAITPVLFASLSRVKDDDKEFNAIFLASQKVMTLFLLPLGFGLFFYRNFATSILFGSAWEEAADIVGVVSLTTAIRTIFISIYGDAYRAKGKVKLPLYLQIIELIILIPICIISIRFGFWTLVYARGIIKLDLLIPEIIIIWKVCGIKVVDTFKNIKSIVVSTIVMSLFIVIMKNIEQSFIFNVISILIAIVVYFLVLLCFKDAREYAKSIIKKRKI